MQQERRIIIIAAACCAAHANAGLIASYTFDETDSGVPVSIIDSAGPIFSSGGAAGALDLDVDGILGSGVAFDGNDDVAGLGGASSEFKQTGDFTVALWVQLPSLAPNVQDRILDATNSNSGIGGAQGWRLLVNPGGAGNAFTLQLQANGNNQAGNINTTFGSLRDLQSTGGWSFIALRYDIDGEASISVLYDSDAFASAALVSTNTQSVASDGALSYGALAAPRLGANQSGTGGYFSGRMDELRLWNTVLTDAELAAEFNGVIPTPASLPIFVVASVGLAARRRHG
ncbi:MAG: LamG-like jellyroll fold domain-containing protein [Planctomycetota bacterium]